MKVMFVVAHPHYPACYTAGTVANHVKQGDEVYVVSMTMGEKVTNLFSEEKIAKINKDEMARAANTLGILEVRYLMQEDTGVWQTNELREKLTDCIREIQPNIIITHWRHDTHPDVRATAELAEDCAFFAMLVQGRWANRFPSHVTSRVYAFSMPGYSRDFAPDFYVDVTNSIEKIRAAVGCLKLHLQLDTNGDVDQWLHPILTADSRWALDTHKGCKYAEAYRRLWIHESVHQATLCLPDK